MFRIGLTGGIGAGKSTTAKYLTQLGAVVVDHDLLAREVVAPGSPGITQVVAKFGPGVLAADGTLDRAALSAQVFADNSQRDALEAIIHPAVSKLADERQAATLAENPQTVVIHDIPLLIETGQEEDFSPLIVVHTPASQRLQRLIDTRGMTYEQAQARIAAQGTDEARLAAADVVLDGSGSEEHLKQQVDALWPKLLES